MRRMKTTTPTPPRMFTDLQELADRILKLIPKNGSAELQPGITLYHYTGPSAPAHRVSEPSFCVIAQGSKIVMLGAEQYRYDPAHYLITTVELPLTGKVIEATPARPYLGFRMILTPSVVASIMMKCGLTDPRDERGGVKAIDVSKLDADLLDATLRLVKMLDKPGDFTALGDSVISEIIYRLLTGPQGARMRHLATFGGHAHRMVRAVETIRENFNRPIRIEEIAKEFGMSVSGFHSHFKAVTAMSPLQFQKHLRLQEARRLMLSENLDAAEAGFRVGYEDASHFNREYKRQFGEPPARDAERLRSALA